MIIDRKSSSSHSSIEFNLNWRPAMKSQAYMNDDKYVKILEEKSFI